jgi:AraC-like DNA-binding protein
VIDLLPLLFLLGAAQGAFLAVALFTGRGGNRRANRYLAAYMLVFVCALIDYFLDATGVTATAVWLRTLLWPKEFLYGVFIYLYCREVTNPGLPLRLYQQLLLWVPPFLHACVTWPLLWLPADLQLAILGNDPSLHGLYGAWRVVLGDGELVVTVGQLAICLALSFHLVKRHRARVLDEFSTLQRVSLVWLRNLLVATSLVYALWLAGEFLIEDLLPGGDGLDVALGLSMVVLIYLFGWLGLRQPLIFSGPRPVPAGPDRAAPAAPSPPSSPPAASTKYARSALSEDLAGALVEELEALMAAERPFRDPELSLAELAARLQVSTNYLSQAINQHAGKNFFDFVNGYRVTDTLRPLAESDRGILAIAMDAGFNSKSAFYAAFRKHQGMTPGQYRKEQRSGGA